MIDLAPLSSVGPPSSSLQVQLPSASIIALEDARLQKGNEAAAMKEKGHIITSLQKKNQLDWDPPMHGQITKKVEANIG